MNKIKKLFVCSTFVLLPICVNATDIAGKAGNSNPKNPLTLLKGADGVKQKENNASKTANAEQQGNNASKAADAEQQGNNASKAADAEQKESDSSKAADAEQKESDSSKTADAEQKESDSSKAADAEQKESDSSKAADAEQKEVISSEKTYFADLYRANKRLANNALADVYDKIDTFYSELNFDSTFKDKELKLLGANYVATLNNEVLDNTNFVSRLGLGYRKLSSKHENEKIDFNIADAGLKLYLSYNISESNSIRNAINVGVFGQGAVTFMNKDKFNFNEIDTALFAQYYLRMKFGIFKTENSATIAYNYNFIRNMKDAKGTELLDKYNKGYLDALLKTKTGFEFKTKSLDFKAFAVASYNARLDERNNDVITIKDGRNLIVKYRDKLNVGLESEVISGIIGIKLNVDYDLIGKDFYYGLNVNMKF